MNNVGYRAIADALREQIDAGDLPPGARLPGENELMSTYGVEQPTARRALEVLKNEGLIVARRGSGSPRCSVIRWSSAAPLPGRRGTRPARDLLLPGTAGARHAGG